jgi:tetratricopeptide (TPR) repeat protein
MEMPLSQTTPPTKDNAYEAQQLVYDAWDAGSDTRESELIRQALALNPRNVDALLYLVDRVKLKPGPEIEVLRNIAKFAEQDLGPKAFKGLRGGFWAAIQTRPYMRTRQKLAECLREAGRLDEAIFEYEGMLDLNPGDNQGVRYHLLPCYLMTGRLKPAGKLSKKYKEGSFNTVFAWCRVLELFLSHDRAGAKRALAVARKQNPFTEAYITGVRRVPSRLPDAYSPGSKEEAACFAEILRDTWKTSPAALEWLDAQKSR